jgi:hypothetical protein
MSYLIKIILQLVNLPQYIMKSCNLCIGNRNRVPGSVILLCCHGIRLLGEVVQTCLDLLHEAIEMSTESSEGGAIEEKESLRGGARGGPGGRAAGSGGSSLLMMAQQGDLVVGQAELRIGHRVGWGSHDERLASKCARGGISVVDEGDDTLTESCDGAVNFMVIAMRDGSLPEVHRELVIFVGFGVAQQYG